jgi:hypothetical protein
VGGDPEGLPSVAPDSGHCSHESLHATRADRAGDDYWKLKILIHTHDSFKKESQPGVSITDPHSHASLAREFLAKYCEDSDLLAMVQYHDEPFALYRQFEIKGKYNLQRFDALLQSVRDWNLFLAFNIIDGYTIGKSREPLHWLFREVELKVKSNFTARDVLPGAMS